MTRVEPGTSALVVRGSYITTTGTRIRIRTRTRFPTKTQLDSMNLFKFVGKNGT